MLCNRCRNHIFSRASTSSRLLLNQSRSYSSTPSFLSSAAPTPSDPSVNLPSSGTTSSQTPKTASESSKPSSSTSNHVRSSCVMGTKLQGLNYMKNKPDLVALDDEEYPSWLWNLLDDKKGKKGKADGSDGEVQMNRKQRKRYEKKLAAAEAAKPRKIPVHEQSIDITPASETANAGDSDLVDLAAKGQVKRGDIRKSAREARRKGIREANFLKGL